MTWQCPETLAGCRTQGGGELLYPRRGADPAPGAHGPEQVEKSLMPVGASLPASRAVCSADVPGAVSVLDAFSAAGLPACLLSCSHLYVEPVSINLGLHDVHCCAKLDAKHSLHLTPSPHGRVGRRDFAHRK